MPDPSKESSKPHASQIHGWIIWVVGAAFVVYQFSLQNTFGVVEKKVGTELQIDALQLNLIAAAFLITYALMQVPIGILLDRFSPRIIMGIGSLLLAVAVYVFSNAESFGVALGSRLVMGIAASGAFVGTALLARRWFLPGIFALAMGLADFSLAAGSWVGNVIFPDMLQSYGWRGIMQGLAVVGVAISVLIFAVVRGRPPGEGVGAGAHVPVRSVPKKIWALVKNRQVWLGSLYYGGMSGTLLAFGGVWNIPFQRSYGLSLEDSAQLNSWLFVGMAISAPLAGTLSDLLKSRKKVMIISSVGSTAMFSACLYLPYGSYTEAAICIAGLGFFLGGAIVVFALISESVKPDNQATAMGICNATGCVGAFILSLVPSYFADIKKGDSVEHFQQGMTVFVIFCGVGLVTAMLVRPTKGQYLCGPDSDNSNPQQTASNSTATDTQAN